MAKKCVKVAASKRAKAHIRCFEGADVKKGGDEGGTSGGSGGASNSGFKDPSSGNYEKARISKGEGFGAISDQEAVSYLKASGIPADMVGTVYVSRMRGGTDIMVEVDDHPDFKMKRIIDLKNKTIKNDHFELIDPNGGTNYKYKGSQVFSRQVEEARSQGFISLETTAARRDRSGESVYNGYYTWPRVGYVAKDKKNTDILSSISKYNSTNKTKHKTLEDLMSDENGRKFWKSTGESFSATFDLNPNSYSSKTLKEYLNR
jgi:hypothetical protein